MRWLVEVSAIGKGDPQAFCVDADSWQRALQIVRAHRGETSAMSGFSIELLEEGYRAVDPVARLRFVVKRAAEGAPLSAIDPAILASAGGSKPPGAKKPSQAPGGQSAAPQPPGAPAPPVAHAGAPAAPTHAAAPATPGAQAASPIQVPAAADSRPKVAPPRPLAQATAQSGKSVPPLRASTPPPPVSVPQAPATLVAPTEVPPQAVPSQPMTEPAPTVVAPQPIGAPLPGLATFSVLSKREEHPSPSAPLSYREYVFVAAPGTAEGVAVSILLGQLELVQASLAGSRSGKLVQLAVFDEAYVGKPPRPPLATLVWKDWRGEPVVSFPRRASVAPPGSKPMASSAVPSLKPASVPPKATLMEPRTTLDDTRSLQSERLPPDTETTHADLDNSVSMAKTTELPMYVPPTASLSKATMLGMPAQSFNPTTNGTPAPGHTQSKSIPPPAPVSKSIPPPAPVSKSIPPAAPVSKSVPPPAPVSKSIPPPWPLPTAAPSPKSFPPPAPMPASAVPPPAFHADAGPATTKSAPPSVAPAPVVGAAQQAANLGVPSRPVSTEAAFAQTLPLSASASPAVPLGVERGPDFTPPPHRPSSSRLPIARPGSRTSGDELITALFEAMHDLHFLRDAIEGADFCLQLAQEVIPSRAGFAHFFDLERREFCLVRAKGSNTAELVGKRHLEGDPVLASAVKARRALVRGSEDAMTSRYMSVGGARSLVLAPVIVAGRTLAVLEMVNPNDGAPFTQDEANAMNYIAEQFGEFLSSRGLVFDHGRTR